MACPINGSCLTPGDKREAMRIQAPIFAIVTPFDGTGNIDYGAFAEYLAFLGRSGVPTLIVNGTTGEFPSMAGAERQKVLEFCRQRFTGSLIANVSACAVEDCLSLLEHACGIGADAAIALPPYYYSNATFDGLVSFFQSVAAKSTIPMLLYNFPKHTNVHITPELLTAVCRGNDSIRGVKDSSGDLDKALALKAAQPDLQIFLGSDTLAFNALDRGLDGTVTGGGSAAPECVLGISQSFAAGRRDRSLKWQEALDCWTAYRKRTGVLEIAVTKAGLAARIPGFPVHVRPPLSPLDRDGVGAAAEYMVNVVMPAIKEASVA